MDRQARLSAIMMSINEYKKKEDQAIYGVELSLKTREYGHLHKCAVKLLAIEEEIFKLSAESKSLQEDIDLEAREMLL
jgi:hypothetical protein